MLAPAVDRRLNRRAATADAGSTTLRVHIPKPLADVLDIVQQQYLVPITFEEGPFESHADLTSAPIKQTDGSAIVFRSLPPLTSASAWMPRPSLRPPPKHCSPHTEATAFRAYAK
ncbi:MAG: hypothetical protein ACLP59_01300 [Bryobacteraceae bacterium]